MQVYWLDLDYLSVARAALRCSAPFTALLYVEYWCKAKYGRLRLQEVDLLSQVCALSYKLIHHISCIYLETDGFSCCQKMA